MSLIIKTNLKISDIPEDKIYQGAKGSYLPVTIIVNEDLNDFQKQGPIFIEQSREEREAKTPKHYLGDSVVVFNDLNTIKTTKVLLEVDQQEV